MTNSRAKFSAVAALAVSLLMVFTTGALGQDTVSGSVEGGSAALTQTFLSQAPVGLLLLGPDLRRPAPQRPAPQPPNNGCGNGNGGWNQWGGGGRCSAVPEGGSACVAWRRRSSVSGGRRGERSNDHEVATSTCLSRLTLSA